MKAQLQHKTRPSQGSRQGWPLWRVSLLAAASVSACAALAAEPASPLAPPENLVSAHGKNPALLSNFADATKWTPRHDSTGVRLTPSDDGFDLEFSPEVVGAPGAGGEYVSSFALRGDFTLDIDYLLKNWPAENGVRLGVGVKPFISSHRASTPEWGEIYSFAAGTASTVPTEDQAGSLRLVRTGDTILGYHRSSPTAAAGS